MTERTHSWLIERWQNSEREYWNGRTGEYPWSRNIDDACRLAREQDAQVVLAWHLKGAGKVSEHVFVGDKDLPQ